MQKALTGLLFVALIIAKQGLRAQTDTTSGIQFQTTYSWGQVVAKAKAENKYIFVDAFTTWCGPCKMMADKVYPDTAVGRFFNTRFISVKVQMDTSKKDDAATQAWYADARFLAKAYAVNAYPTYLFFRPDGLVVHKGVGFIPSSQFIGLASRALDSSSQYFELLRKFRAGDRDTAMLETLLEEVLDNYDDLVKPEVLRAYLAHRDIFNLNTLTLIKRATQATTDTGFTILLHNQTRVDAVLGKGTAEARLRNIVRYESAEPYIEAHTKPGAAPDWNLVKKMLSKKWPLMADDIVALLKLDYFKDKKDLDNLEHIVNSILQYRPTLLTGDALNDAAWTVFQQTSDTKFLHIALGWSNRAIKKMPDNPYFMDTHANILYKLGRIDEAILEETQAVRIVGTNDVANLNDTLKKMKAGGKTW